MKTNSNFTILTKKNGTPRTLRNSKYAQVGQWVILSEDGALAHDSYHKNGSTIMCLILGAATLPILIGSGVGIAMGGTAFALGTSSQAAIGGATGALLSKTAVFKHPTALQVGKVIRKRGADIQIEWIPQSLLKLPKAYRKKLTTTSSWHLGKHLIAINSDHWTAY